MPDIKLIVRQSKRSFQRIIFRLRLKNRGFCIVASNCWGSRIYKELNFPFNTPFVGLFIHSPDYLRLLSDLRKYLAQPLGFIDQSKYPETNEKRAIHSYPIGLLGDEVEIHFLHYRSPEEANQKWQKRLARMDLENLFIAYNDRDCFQEAHLKRYENLPFDRKVFFTTNSKLRTPSAVYISEWSGQPYVGDLYANSHLVHRHFDVIGWLNNETGEISPWIQFLNRLVEA